jgi:hypothetical protein
MNPNLVVLLVLAFLILSLFAGEIYRFAMDWINSRMGPPKCRGGRCGEFGWAVARKDSESCHALCYKCRWMSHFDIRQWEELNRR